MPKNTSKGTNVISTNASAKRAKSSSTRPLTALNSTQHTKQLFGSKRKAVAPGASMQQPRSKKQRQQQQAQQLKQMPTSAKPNHPRCQPVSSACQQRHAAAATAAGDASAAAGADDAIAQASAGLVTPAFNIAAAGSKEPQDDEVRRLFRSWAWKREHRPDKDRFYRPYVHSMSVPDSSGAPQQLTVTIKQQKFGSEGFASTVWDSSIVVAKYLEKLGYSALRGKRCLDLSAGCGLVGVVMAKLGAEVTLTDLAGNLPLLQYNCRTNGVPEAAVVEHRWGEDVSALKPPFDIIVACDVMYVHELVQPLLQSLLTLSSTQTTLLVAHGRNRPAEPDFRAAAAAAQLHVELVPAPELDDVYQCSDVDVLRLTHKQ